MKIISQEGNGIVRLKRKKPIKSIYIVWKETIPDQSLITAFKYEIKAGPMRNCRRGNIINWEQGRQSQE